MTAAAIIRRYATLNEYYQVCSNDTETKYELFQGVIYAMTRGTTRHANLCDELYFQLRSHSGRSDTCKPHGSEYHIGHDFSKLPGHDSPRTPFRAHPDASIVCGNPIYLEGEACSNPVVLFEVTSPSTENYDFNLKFDEYRRIETLEIYVIIAHDQPCITVFDRASGWQARNYVEATVDIHGFKIDVSELYSWAENG